MTTRWSQQVGRHAGRASSQPSRFAACGSARAAQAPVRCCMRWRRVDGAALWRIHLLHPCSLRHVRLLALQPCMPMSHLHPNPGPPSPLPAGQASSSSSPRPAACPRTRSRRCPAGPCLTRAPRPATRQRTRRRAWGRPAVFWPLIRTGGAWRGSSQTPSARARGASYRQSARTSSRLTPRTRALPRCGGGGSGSGRAEADTNPAVCNAQPMTVDRHIVLCACSATTGTVHVLGAVEGLEPQSASPYSFAARPPSPQPPPLPGPGHHLGPLL
jgi:hypothetical protein